MIHEGVIKWHDLVEDPSDLPPDSGWYMVTTVVNRIWSALAAATLNSRIEAHYDIETKTWTVESQHSYKTLDNVIAWAEYFPPYDSPSIQRI